MHVCTYPGYATVFSRPTSRNIIYLIVHISGRGHEIWNVPHLLVLLIGCCSMLICDTLQCTELMAVHVRYVTLSVQGRGSNEVNWWGEMWSDSRSSEHTSREPKTNWIIHHRNRNWKYDGSSHHRSAHSGTGSKVAAVSSFYLCAALLTS